MKRSAFLALVLVTCLLCCSLTTYSSAESIEQASNGVDDLRGRWDVSVYNSEAVIIGPLHFYINDLTLNPNDAEEWLAAGCMESAGGMAPLSLLAIPVDDNSYNVTIISTVIPTSGNPMPVRFIGRVETFGSGVTDDKAEGNGPEIEDTKRVGTWQALHHDRRRSVCPAVQIPPLSMWGDVGVHVIYPQQVVKTIYEVQTDIPAAAAVVTRPDGTSMLIKPLVDNLKTPEFHAKFVFQTSWDESDSGYPTPDTAYRFTLLDVIGQSIAGATAVDSWTSCTISPPKNITATVMPGPEPRLLVAWDPVVEPPGADSFGTYALLAEHYPPQGGPFLFNAAFMKQPEHTIPWSFEAGAAGSPDGYDFGSGLGDVVSDNTYQIRVDAYSVSESPSNHGWECHVVDFDQNVLFRKEADGSIVVLGKP